MRRIMRYIFWQVANYISRSMIVVNKQAGQFVNKWL